jgi:hypothetical protein
MSSPYPIEALDYPVMNLADVIRFDLDATLISNDASETHGLYALAQVLARRLQSYPIAESGPSSHEGLIALIRINALVLGEEE